MEENKNICQTCHQPILPQYFFCPNCGVKLNTAPLSTTVMTQIGIYLFSIILPLICFIFITRWPGLKYSKSKDEKTKSIGFVAWGLLIISTLLVIWFSYTWTQQAIKNLNDSLNMDLKGLTY